MKESETLAALDDERQRLLADISHPPLTVGIDALKAMWEYDAARFICDRPADFEEFPELPVRIRGAFGRALHAQPLRADRRGQLRLPAVEALFEHSSWLPANREIAKPFVVRAWPEGDAMMVELRLFGFANHWLDQAIEAMCAALQGGIAIRSERSFRVPLVIRDILVTRSGAAPTPPSARSAALHFRSPVSVRRNDRRITAADALVSSVIRRVDTLAAWQFARLEHDPAVLRAAVNELVIDDRDLSPYSWLRHSRRGGDAAIPVGGMIGRLRLEGAPLATLAGYLLIAETCNTGSHAALGLGWFELALYP